MSASASNSESVTASLAASCRALAFEALPPDVVFLAKQCLLDWFGVALAGSREPLAVILRNEALAEGGHPQATLIGSGERVSTRQAAVVNGAASHALDFDDVQMTMSGHPTVPVAPAALALAETRGDSGRALITAFVTGFEMESRVGALMMPGHYAAGWHATGTVGTFGAAAACAHLLGLDQTEWQMAMGIAGTQAAGLKSMFGTMCKPLHAGKAAENGLRAATLAAAGFTSNPNVLDVAQGFTATQTTTPHPNRAAQDMGADFAIRRVLFKYHAACYGTHETIEGMLRLRAKYGLTPADVGEIRLTVPAGNLSMCNIQEPATALEGKFSLRFTAALALATEDTSDHAFTDDAVHDHRLTELRDRVNVVGREGGAGTDVSIRLRDGREIAESVNLQTPATDLDLQWQRLVAKYRALAEPVIGGDQSERLLGLISRLETLDSVAPLLHAAAPRLHVGLAR
jgi:2-methylcitrate dehydratase PrpD